MPIREFPSFSGNETISKVGAAKLTCVLSFNFGVYNAVSYTLLAINGDPVSGRKYKDVDILDEFLTTEENYPLNLK